MIWRGRNTVGSVHTPVLFITRQYASFVPVANAKQSRAELPVLYKLKEWVSKAVDEILHVGWIMYVSMDLGTLKIVFYERSTWTSVFGVDRHTIQDVFQCEYESDPHALIVMN